MIVGIGMIKQRKILLLRNKKKRTKIERKINLCFFAFKTGMVIFLRTGYFYQTNYNIE